MSDLLTCQYCGSTGTAEEIPDELHLHPGGMPRVLYHIRTTRCWPCYEMLARAEIKAEVAFNVERLKEIAEYLKAHPLFRPWEKPYRPVMDGSWKGIA